MFALSRSHIELTGRDRASFLHNFCTNDITSLKPGQGCEAFLCNVKGRVLGHVTVFAEPDSLWLETVAGAAPALIAHLDRYLIREDVQLHDRTADVAELHVVGPQAVLALAPDNRRRAHPVDWFREPSWVVIGPRDALEQCQREMLAANVVVGTDADWQSLRIAAGFPEYGVDLTDDNLPQEAARNAKCLSFTKGCYLGQEPIARLDAMGHTNRELRRLRIAGDDVPVTPVALLDPASGQEAGRLTSAAVAPDGPGIVGLGMIKTRWLAAGTELRVANLAAGVVATVCE